MEACRFCRLAQSTSSTRHGATWSTDDTEMMHQDTTSRLGSPAELADASLCGLGPGLSGQFSQFSQQVKPVLGPRPASILLFDDVQILKRKGPRTRFRVPSRWR